MCSRKIVNLLVVHIGLVLDIAVTVRGMFSPAFCFLSGSWKSPGAEALQSLNKLIFKTKQNMQRNKINSALTIWHSPSKHRFIFFSPLQSNTLRDVTLPLGSILCQHRHTAIQFNLLPVQFCHWNNIVSIKLTICNVHFSFSSYVISQPHMIFIITVFFTKPPSLSFMTSVSKSFTYSSSCCFWVSFAG